MKNVGEIMDKMDEVKKVQIKLQHIADAHLAHEQGRDYSDDIECAVDLLNEYICVLRAVRVNF